MDEDLGEERLLAARLKEWNCLRLQNQMVQFKRMRAQNKQSCTFENYVAANMPENIKMAEDGVTVLWLDERLAGENWKGTFEQVRADQPLHIVGEMPQLGCDGGAPFNRIRRTPSLLTDDASIDSINSRSAELAALGLGGGSSMTSSSGVAGRGGGSRGVEDDERRRQRRRRKKKERRERESRLLREQQGQRQRKFQHEDPAMEARPSSDPKNGSGESGLVDTAGDVVAAMRAKGASAGADTSAHAKPGMTCEESAPPEMMRLGAPGAEGAIPSASRGCTGRAGVEGAGAGARSGAGSATLAQGSPSRYRAAQTPASPAALMEMPPPRHAFSHRAVVTLSSPQRADLLTQKLRAGRITELEYNALLAADRRAAAMDAEL